MRAVIAIAVVILILVLIGWVSFGIDGGRGTVEFDSDKAQQDTENVAEGIRDLADDAAEGLDRTERTNDAEDAPVVETDEVELEPST